MARFPEREEVKRYGWITKITRDREENAWFHNALNAVLGESAPTRVSVRPWDILDALSVSNLTGAEYDGLLRAAYTSIVALGMDTTEGYGAQIARNRIYTVTSLWTRDEYEVPTMAELKERFAPPSEAPVEASGQV